MHAAGPSRLRNRKVVARNRNHNISSRSNKHALLARNCTDLAQSLGLGTTVALV